MSDGAFACHIIILVYYWMGKLERDMGKKLQNWEKSYDIEMT